jgi:hypothetical protein
MAAATSAKMAAWTIPQGAAVVLCRRFPNLRGDGGAGLEPGVGRRAARASLAYGESTLALRNDLAVALVNASRALIEASHRRLAQQKQWVLNEKGIVDRAGLAGEAEMLVAATDRAMLLDVMGQIRRSIETP